MEKAQKRVPEALPPSSNQKEKWATRMCACGRAAGGIQGSAEGRLDLQGELSRPWGMGGPQQAPS